jgi:hypothetical protein
LALVDALQTEKSPFASKFQLKTTSYVTCHTCHNTFPRQENAFDISVEVDSVSNNNNAANAEKPEDPPAATSSSFLSIDFVPPKTILSSMRVRLIPADRPRLLAADLPVFGDVVVPVVASTFALNSGENLVRGICGVFNFLKLIRWGV